MSKKLPDDGLVLVVKEDCPTCRLIAPVAAELEERGFLAAAYSQDNQEFPARVRVTDDRDLEASFHLGITIVPTLIRFEASRETGRSIGWVKEEWCSLAGVRDLGSELPAERPGCGSLSAQEGWAEELLARHGDTGLGSATVTAPFPEDPLEVMFERGWTDGLPVVPPTPARVLRMLQASRLANDHVLGLIPPSGCGLHGGKGGHQCRHGRMPSRVPSGCAGCTRCGARSGFRLAGPSLHDHGSRRVRRRQRSGGPDGSASTAGSMFSVTATGPTRPSSGPFSSSP